MQNTMLEEKITKKRTYWGLDLLLIPLLIFGWFYRTVGQDWDQGQLLHPDELFLVQVEQAIQPVDSLADYWDTDNSSLNPNNRGMDFFVYGTLPITLTRYVVDRVGESEWFLMITDVGRNLSAAFDLATVLVVYLIGSKLYDRRVGFLAAFFSTFSVLNIQLSHFFAVDTFTAFFTTLALYFAVRVAVGGKSEKAFRVMDFIFFGIALGMATACKVTIVFVALTFPIAILCRLAKLEKEKQTDAFRKAMVFLSGAAVISFFVFRVFQPYAFSGPGFFNMSLNPKWLENLKSLSVMAAGDVDWPPSLQWARIPLTYSGENLIRWGLGIPLGVTAFLGLGWMLWKMIKGEWAKYATIFVWASLYFAWQSSVFNPSMRYQIPIYSSLVIIGAWFLVSIWEHVRNLEIKPILKKIASSVVLISGMGVVIGTLIWASAFINIYRNTEPRIAASEWIYENIPGPLTLEIEKDGEVTHEQVSIPYSNVIRPGVPYTFTYVSKTDGYLNQINVHNLEFQKTQISMLIELIDQDIPEIPIATTRYDQEFDSSLLLPEINYAIRITPYFDGGEVSLLDLEVNVTAEDQLQRISIDPMDPLLNSGTSFEMDLDIDKISIWNSVYLKIGFIPQEIGTDQKLTIELGNITNELGLSTYAEINLDQNESAFIFDEPLLFEKGKYYTFRMLYYGENPGVILSGSAIGIETSWDRGLPLPIDGYNGYGGVYKPGMDFDLYADDTDEKRVKLLDKLEQVEYITISSSRVWASISRLPERFPLVDLYYRLLIGCPDDLSVEECYNVAEEGMFTGQMGFDLVAIIDSNPQYLDWEINDQYAEEAFTVYDHPKTFIFQKSEDYDHSYTSALLNDVDLSNFIRLLPKDAGDYEPPSTIMLPESNWEDQQGSGTWSELYDTAALINKSQFLTAVCWYLALMLLGIGFYPIIRLLLPNLADRGYPLARVAGLLVLAYLSWLGGSVGLSFERGWIFVFYMLILLTGLVLGYFQRQDLLKDLKENKSYFFNIEIIFLALFILSLLVRLGNPDLWHPYKGGEKPMDFAYFNAVLKSTSFPPYDPWYAGGYINYYYFGFVLVGVLVKKCWDGSAADLLLLVQRWQETLAICT
jgi:4-amino-4-deoxy-L-arabinose transferase-like glycosyltransferase